MNKAICLLKPENLKAKEKNARTKARAWPGAGL
jgi:hypothetical protein